MWGDPDQDARDLDLDKNWKVLELNLEILHRKQKRRWFFILFFGLLGIAGLLSLFYSMTHQSSETNINSVLAKQEVAVKEEIINHAISQSTTTVPVQENKIHSPSSNSKTVQLPHTNTNKNSTSSNSQSNHVSNDITSIKTKSPFNHSPKVHKNNQLKIQTSSYSNTNNKTPDQPDNGIAFHENLKQQHAKTETTNTLQQNTSKPEDVKPTTKDLATNNQPAKITDDHDLTPNFQIEFLSENKDNHQVEQSIFLVQDKIPGLKNQIQFNQDHELINLPSLNQQFIIAHKPKTSWISIVAGVGLSAYHINQVKDEYQSWMNQRKNSEVSQEAYVFGLQYARRFSGYYYLKSGLTCQSIYHNTKFSYFTNTAESINKFRWYKDENGNTLKIDDYVETDAVSRYHKDVFYNRYTSLNIPVSIGRIIKLNPRFEIQLDAGMQLGIIQHIKGFIPNTEGSKTIYTSWSDLSYKRIGQIQGIGNVMLVGHFSSQYFASFGLFGNYDLNSRLTSNAGFQEKNNVVGLQLNLGKRF